MEHITDEMVEDSRKQLRAYVIGSMPNDFKELPIDEDQTCTIAFPDQAKVAALLFDKIWVPPRPFQAHFGFNFENDQPPDELRFFCKKDVEDFRKIGIRRFFSGGGTLITDEDKTFIELFIERVNEISARYENNSRFVRTLKCGTDLNGCNAMFSNAPYQAVIKNVQLPINEKLDWKQILEMRKDKESIDRLRSMRLWLNDGLKAQSEAEATDQIQEKLKRYDDALKKHGAITRAGVLTSVFSGACSFANKPDESGVILGLSLIGGISLMVLKQEIENASELKQPGLREVAWLHEIHRKPFLERVMGWFRE